MNIEQDALATIARVAEGSVRDALSLLDQTIAHGGAGAGAPINADDLRHMLGLADKTRVIDLFEATMSGAIAQALGLLAEQYDGGADPAQILLELAEFTHLVTQIKVAPDTSSSSALTPEEARRGMEQAEKLSLPALSRAWQILAKGLDEMRGSQTPLASADMVLVRLAHAAELPTPDEALRRLAHLGEASPAPQSGTPRPPSPAAPPRAIFAAAPALARAAPAPTANGVTLADFDALVALADAKRDIRLKIALERDVRLVRFEPGRLEFELAPGGSPALAATIAARLQDWTGERWMVALATRGGHPSLAERREAKERERRSGLEADPVVAAVLAQFPGAQIIAVRNKNAESPAAPDADVAYSDPVEPEEE